RTVSFERCAGPRSWARETLMRVSGMRRITAHLNRGARRTACMEYSSGSGSAFLSRSLTRLRFGILLRSSFLGRSMRLSEFIPRLRQFFGRLGIGLLEEVVSHKVAGKVLIRANRFFE